MTHDEVRSLAMAATVPDIKCKWCGLEGNVDEVVQHCKDEHWHQYEFEAIMYGQVNFAIVGKQGTP